jgi:hypothetical protein
MNAQQIHVNTPDRYLLEQAGVMIFLHTHPNPDAVLTSGPKAKKVLTPVSSAAFTSGH